MERVARVSLLDRFEVSVGGRVVAVPPLSQRVLAFLALERRPVRRHRLAGALWPDTTDARASASLRTALWRLGEHRGALLESNDVGIDLRPGVEVDIRRMEGAASLLKGPLPAPDEALDLTLYRGALLPDWWEDWVLFERERLRQLQLHALESVCAQLTGAGRHPEAVEAGLAAVAAEPLRESARHALMQAYLAEANAAEALREYERFRVCLAREVGLEPSPAMKRMVADIGRAPGGVVAPC